MEKDTHDQFTGSTELLQQLINQFGAQNNVLTNILKQCKISVCLLDKIARQTCMSLNEQHYQTELQKSIKEAMDTLLEVYKSSHAEEFLKYEQIENLKKELLKCCPPEDPEPLCKPDKIDCSRQGDDNDLDSGYTYSRLCDPVRSKISKEGYKPYKINFEDFEDDDEIPKVTVGKFRGLNKPAIRTFNVLDYKGGAAPGGGADPVIFNKFTNIGKKVTTGYIPPDMDGAIGGGVVLMTGNFFLGVSVDGGVTFDVADPTTIFPKDTTYGGWGCDQIMVYAPSINRFIWLMQAFPGTGGKRSANDVGQNIVRVAYASPEDVIKHKTNLTQAFSYYDFDSNYFSLASNGWMDYPDMSLGDNFLYLSIDSSNDYIDGAGNKQNSTVGRLVFRIPLNELRDGSITNCRVTNAADSAGALKSQLTKNTGNEIYWAGHKKKSDGTLDNGTITLFSWNEGSTQYTWRDVALQANWPSGSSGTLTSLTPSPESVEKLSSRLLLLASSPIIRHLHTDFLSGVGLYGSVTSCYAITAYS